MGVELPDPTFPADGPLIIQTLAKPFLPGRQIFALYQNHVVIATVRGPLTFPEGICRSNGHALWPTLARTRKVSVIPISKIDWIRSYEHGVDDESSVKLTFESKKSRWSVTLSEEAGAKVMTYLANNFGDKFDARVESAVDVKRKARWSLFLWCIVVDGYVAWCLYTLWNTQTMYGPKIFVGFIRLVYEARGFSTAAGVTILCTIFLNLLLSAFWFASPPTKRRTMNCGNCGYSLRGSTANRCPECGEKT